MKVNFRWYVFLLPICIYNCEKVTESDKYKPELIVKTNTQSREYDVSTPIDTFRIAYNLRILIGAKANGYSNAYIENVNITDVSTNEIIADTSIYKSQHTLALELQAPEYECAKTYKIQIFDNIGNSADTLLHYNFVDGGILSFWTFSNAGIEGFLEKAGISQINMSFKKNGAYGITIIGQNYEQNMQNGKFQQKRSDEIWHLTLSQLNPDTVTYSGVFKITGTKRDSITMYYVQTKPDVGILPPMEFVDKASYGKGEYFLTGKFNN